MMDADRIDAWLRTAETDARQRGLGELKPLLEALARAMAGLREADRCSREEDAPPPPSNPDAHQ
jgi:hypothetical protein